MPHLPHPPPTSYGDLDIIVPSYPSQNEKRSEEVAAGMKREGEKTNKIEEGRKLFAHFLWSAAMVVAEVVEDDESSSSGMGEDEDEDEDEM